MFFESFPRGFVCPRWANIGEINIGNIVWIRSFIIAFTIAILLSLSDCVIIFLVFSFLPPSGVNCVICSLFSPFCMKFMIEVCVRCSACFSTIFPVSGCFLDFDLFLG